MVQQSPNFQEQKIAYWLVISGERVLQFTQSPGVMNCSWAALDFAKAYAEEVLQIGEHKGQPCYLIDMGAEQPEGSHLESVSLRSLILKSEPELFGIAARAWQFALFLRTHRFCGQCGSHMQKVHWELAMQCETCGHRCYPRISPCIIVAIRKGNQILLAQGKQHKNANNMYSTLAGFVESGESLEEAVHREVFEEVGIKVKNLEYFSSQPWPFPHSLMVGYLAEYDSGDIVVDGHEILEAKWFDFDDLPFVPPTFSIAGQLIETTISKYQN